MTVRSGVPTSMLYMTKTPSEIDHKVLTPNSNRLHHQVAHEMAVTYCPWPIGRVIGAAHALAVWQPRCW